MKTFNIILISVIASLLVFVIFVNVPAKWFNISQFFSQKLGTAFTTLTGTETLSAFPTTYNANLALTPNLTTTNTFTGSNTLNGLLILQGAASSTQFSTARLFFGGTSTSSTGLDGSLTLITPLLAASGGTATGSPALYRVLLGNASNGVTVASSTGTSGQILTSNGGGAYPSWQSGTFDQTGSYTLTGAWLFNGASTFVINNASSTVTGKINVQGSDTTTHALVINGVSYRFPSTNGASSTALLTDGSGSLTWDVPTLRHYSFATTGPITLVCSSCTNTSSFFTIPAGIMTASSTITFDAEISSCLSAAGAGATCDIQLEDGSGVAMASGRAGYNSAVLTDSKIGSLHALIFNNGSVSSQKSFTTAVCVDPTLKENAGCQGNTITSAVNTAAALTLRVKFSLAGGVSATLDGYSITVDP